MAKLKKIHIVCIIIFTISSFIIFSKTSTSNGIEKHNDVTSIILTQNKSPFSYIDRYDGLRKCGVAYKESVKDMPEDYKNTVHAYSLPADQYLYEKKITRGFLFYFPINSFDYFMPEFKWLYRSWIEMQKYEPKHWRTDLIIFIDRSKKSEKFKFFTDLNCQFGRLRQSKEDEPMCILIDYLSIADRHFQPFDFNGINDPYKYLYEKIDIFNDTSDNLKPFYTKLKEIDHYGYVDSILVVFDGFKYVEKYYDFVLRSDMDVFMTPLFGTWLPRHCNDFILGNGGYSTRFNTNRLARIADNLNLSYAFEDSLGSTWYSTPNQFRLVSYLTLVSMIYISNEEFTLAERAGKIEVLNWPEWHYGVLLYYGQHIAVNHLIAKKQINAVKLPRQLDVDSASDARLDLTVHIHQYHSPNLFSKFAFKKGEYDKMNVTDKDKSVVAFYSLWIALESKRLSADELNRLRGIEAGNKLLL